MDYERLGYEEEFDSSESDSSESEVVSRKVQERKKDDESTKHVNVQGAQTSLPCPGKIRTF